MNSQTIAQLILGLGLGGIAGALAAIWVAGGRLAAAVSVFSEAFQRYVTDRHDVETDLLREDFEEVKRETAGLLDAVGRLRRGLKFR